MTKNMTHLIIGHPVNLYFSPKMLPPPPLPAAGAVGEMALALWEYQVGAGSREPK